MANEIRKVITPIVVIFALLGSLAIFFYKNYGFKQNSRQVVSLKQGESVPDFEVERIPDKKIEKLSAIQSKVIWVHFWATWCQSCVVEMPAINRTWEKYKNKGLEIVAISLDDDPPTDVPMMIRKLKTKFPVYWNPDQTLSEIFDVSFIPLSIFLDQNRKIIWIERGEGDWDSTEMHETIESWLNK